MRGRVLGVWGTVRTAWSLAGPPALGLLMELAGARGALVTGGLLVAGAVGAGYVLHERRAAKPVAVRTGRPAPAGQPALETAA
jgi:hypothetical protein